MLVTPKKLGQYTVYTALIFILAMAPYNLLTGKDILGSKEVLECGLIINKLQPDDMSLGKYNANIRVINIMVVKYPTKVVDEEVDASTYNNSKIGEEICFEIRERNDSIIYEVFSMISTILDIMILLALSVLGLQKLFSDEK